MEVSDLNEKIAFSSNEQAAEIKQITHGTEQVSIVIQTNAATAEESAASSEELSGQSNLLKLTIDHFQI